MRRALRFAVVGIVLVHGLLEAAAGLGLLPAPDGRPVVAADGRAAWLAVGAATLLACGLLAAGVRWWWALGIPAAAAGQLLVFTAWPQAAAGTAANAVLLLAGLHGLAVDGPWSLRAHYRRMRRDVLAGMDDLPAWADAASDPVLTREDLAGLPEPVAAYVTASGALGRPRVRGFRARISGRIRGGPDQPWMTFTGDQVNVLGPRPQRLFSMDATMRGVGADVLHTYRGDSARMRVRVAGLWTMVDASGPQLLAAETVTVLNDLCVLAPAALVDAPISWTPVDRHRARARFTNAGCTVSAELVVDDHGRLVDFVSDDRLVASPDGRTFTPMRWSTPLAGYPDSGGRIVAGRGHGRWHPVDAPAYDYLDIVVESIEYLERSPVTTGGGATAAVTGERPAGSR